MALRSSSSRRCKTPPSDHPIGFDVVPYRIGAEQSTDAEAIVAYLREHTPVPIWVVGMSKGSFSAANTALALGEAIGGFGVVSASTSPGGLLADLLPRGIISMGLGPIAGRPAMVVGPADDKCPGPPPGPPVPTSPPAPSGGVGCRFCA